MKKLVPSLFVAAMLTLMMSACQVYSFEARGSRNVEPQHQVFTVPIVADVEFLSSEKITYSETFAKADLDNIENYKYVVLAHALRQYNADFMVGALYDVNYLSNGRTLEVTVMGFPVKYKELRKATPEDQWFIDNKVQ